MYEGTKNHKWPGQLLKKEKSGGTMVLVHIEPEDMIGNFETDPT